MRKIMLCYLCLIVVSAGIMVQLLKINSKSSPNSKLMVVQAFELSEKELNKVNVDELTTMEEVLELVQKLEDLESKNEKLLELIELSKLQEETPKDYSNLIIEYINSGDIAYKVYTPEREYDFKSYMSYLKIEKGTQLKLQGHAYTGNYGIRMVGDKYCVAIGYGAGCKVGQYVDLVLENGIIIECIVGDIKAEAHTDAETHLMTANLCVSEFIVDTDAMDPKVVSGGNMSKVNDDWKSPVVEILVHSNNYFD